MYDKDPSKAAPPGKSAHGTGLAIDINSKEANELDSMGLLSKYGFGRPVKGEAWHLQAAGTAAALAKAGGISADSPKDQSSQSSASGSQASGSAQQVADAIPQAPAAAPQAAPEAGGQGRASATVAMNPKGSTQSISTLSFRDPNLLVLNVGMLA